MSRNVQFVTDAEGNKVTAILPLEEYEEMLEDLQLSRIARASKGEERVPWQQVRAELKAEGRLND